MLTLLSLPRELRDQIIEYVIRSHKEAPSDPANDLQSRQDATGQCALRLPNELPLTYNAAGLLGASLQLRNETQDRMSQLDISYSLDVMVVDNELWPTWTCCPRRAPGVIDTVHVTLRFFSKPNDPFMVHVARTLWAILQGRKWTSASLHPLAELFLHVSDVCFQMGSKDTNVIRSLCFDASAANHLNRLAPMMPSEPLANIELKSLFGKHRSLWNSFRSIHQYPFSENREGRTLEPLPSLKIMIILMMQESWEDECAAYSTYVGPLGAAFRSVQSIRFVVDGQDLGRLTSRIVSR